MIAERPFTHGAIALLNLGAQIDALEPQVRLVRSSVETRTTVAVFINARRRFCAAKSAKGGQSEAPTSGPPM